MTLTEEEAKTKWCQESIYETSKCLGSACMAWRWRTEGGSYEAVSIGYSSEAYARLVPGSGVPSTTHGYCGKAGRP